jgi:hypothetical protein
MGDEGGGFAAPDCGIGNGAVDPAEPATGNGGEAFTMDLADGGGGAGGSGGGSPYGDMFGDGSDALAAAGVGGPPELGPDGLDIPEGIEQEYTVSPELEDLAARVARGELSAEDAQKLMNQGGKGAGEGAAEGAGEAAGEAAAEGESLVGQVGSGLASIGSKLTSVFPPVFKNILNPAGSAPSET